MFESAAAGYTAPTKQVQETFVDLKAQVEVQLKLYDNLKKEGIKALNEAVHKLGIPVIGN